MRFLMRRFIILQLCLIYFTINSCNLPELNPPEELLIYRILSQSMRSSNSGTVEGTDGSSNEGENAEGTLNPVRFSVIFNTVTYNPGDRVELGTGQEGVESSYLLKVVNTGEKALKFRDASPYTVNTTSTGTFNLQPTGTFPDTWDVGVEVELELKATPDSATENLWSVDFHFSEPEVLDIRFDFAIFVEAPTRGDMIFMTSLSPSQGVYKIDFSTTDASLGTPVKIGDGFGSVCASQSLVYSDDRKYLYHVSPTNDSIVGGELNIDGTYTELTGSPFPMPLSNSILFPIPTKNKILAYRDMSGSATTFDRNTTTGALENSVNLGFMCAGTRLWASHNGEYFYGGPNPASGKDIAIYKNNPAGGLDPAFLGLSPNTPDRLLIHLMSRTKPYLYSATYHDVPGANNLKIDKILRRTLDASGVPGPVDSEFAISRDGARYLQFLSHPNDLFYYLVGVIGTTDSVIHRVVHDPDTGTLNPDPSPMKLAGVNRIHSPSISPDGKYLMGLAYQPATGLCSLSIYRHRLIVFEIDQTTGVLSLKTDSELCLDKPTAVWGYAP